MGCYGSGAHWRKYLPVVEGKDGAGMTDPEKSVCNRRVDDPRIQKFVDDVAIVKRTHERTRRMEDDILRITGEQIKMCTTINEISITMNQVRDILVTFKMTGIVVKWITTIGAAITAIGAAIATVYYFFIRIK